MLIQVLNHQTLVHKLRVFDVHSEYVCQLLIIVVRLFISF